MALRADEKRLELLCDIAPDVPQIVRGDSNRLRQVVLNLLGNAIKFTETGEVALRVRLEGTGGNAVTLHLVIADTGIGIPPERQETIFDPFVQADASTVREYGGTGLGLSISSRLVQMMGGRIWLQSKAGEGSEFHFTLRMELPEAEGAASSMGPLPDSCRGARVLVVDDNPASRQLLEQMLKRWELRATAVAGGREALDELFSACETADPYTLALIDMRMPGMDGLTVVEQIVVEQIQRRLSVIPIPMLSAGSVLGDIKRCRELGVDTYLVKPIRQSELRAAIARCLGAPAAEDTGETSLLAHTQAVDARPIPSMRVLVAEDNRVNQLLITRMLEKDGHRPTIVANGRQALDALDEERYDLVLMDVEMPEMDGLEATRQIRKRERASGERQWVVGLSAHAMKGDKERCLAQGMDDYLTKPIQQTTLRELLSQHAPHADLQAETLPCRL